MTATLPVSCHICQVKYVVGKDIQYCVDASALPVGMRARWMHAQCGVRLLLSRGIIDQTASGHAMASITAAASLMEHAASSADAPEPVALTEQSRDFVDEHPPIIRQVQQATPGDTIAVAAGAQELYRNPSRVQVPRM